MDKEIVWVEDSKGNTIFIQSFDIVGQFDEMMMTYRKWMAKPKVKAFRMPLQELIIDVKIDTPL